MELYLIQSGLCIILSYIGYLCFFRNDNTLVRNRIFLLGSLLSSFIIPFIHFPGVPTLVSISHVPEVNAGLAVPILFTDSQGGGSGNGSGPISTFTATQILMTVYLTGVLVFALHFLWQFFFLIKAAKKSEKAKVGNFELFFHAGSMSHFSIFNFVFINKSLVQGDADALNKILVHEQGHAKQGHTIDLLILSIASIIQWFNPAIWFFRKAFHEQHEFLADQEVLRAGINQGDYQILLLNQVMGTSVFSFTNSFNHVNLKKRIIMMTRINSSIWTRIKGLLIIPIMIGLVFLAGSFGWQSLPLLTQSFIHGQIKESGSGKPISDAAVVIKNSTEGTMTDLDGKFSLKVDDNKTLVISHIGYKTIEFEIGGLKDIKLSMEKNVTELPATDVYANAKIKGQKFYFLNDKQITNEEFNKLNPQDLLLVKQSTDENELKKFGLDKNSIIYWFKQKEHNPKNENVKVGQLKTTASEEKKEVFTVVEELPEYPGGSKMFSEYINQHLVYPTDATDQGIEGTVIAKFTVGRDGMLKNVEILRGLFPSLDAEAKRVLLSSPAWKPGMQKGKPVEVDFTIPINFELTPELFYVVEEMPTFQGEGIEKFQKDYLQKALVYPEQAKKQGIQGKVIITFTVNAKGKVVNVNLERGVSPLLDLEALRAVSNSPDWTPGKQAGKNVAVQFTVPVFFVLSGNKP